MNFINKIAEMENINGISIDRIKRVASSRSVSQEEFAKFLGISISGFRQKLKEHKIRWRNRNGRIIKRKTMDNTSTSLKKNESYFNPGINSRIKIDFGNGYLPIR